MEYGVAIYPMPKDQQSAEVIEDYLNAHAKERWRVHKIYQSYRGTQLIVIYERVRH